MNYVRGVLLHDVTSREKEGIQRGPRSQIMESLLSDLSLVGQRSPERQRSWAKAQNSHYYRVRRTDHDQGALGSSTT